MERYTVARANQFINEQQHTVNSQYRPAAHFAAPVGWVNDPNGCIFYQGEYHLFYQYYPYDAVWGPMHWGHAKSKDSLTWEHLPVALAPDAECDKDGCFSGSAIEKDGKLWLMYTGNLHVENGTGRQVQNMAVSEDGIHFEKIAQNPVLTEKDLPSEVNPADFRDPKVFEKDGKYYAVIAARHNDGVGCILLYSSNDLVDWQYESIFLKGTKEQGEMWECPDFFTLDGQDTLIMSPMRVPQVDLSHHNINTTVVVKGAVNWETKQFVAESFEELDHGHEFYAPQTLLDNQGRRIMIAWMNTWGRNNFIKDLGHNWAHSMTVPRVLTWRDGQLIQQPFIDQTQLSAISALTNVTDATYVNVAWQDEQDGFVRIGSKDDYYEITYHQQEHAVYLDRTHLVNRLIGEEPTPVMVRGVRIKEAKLSSLSLIIDTNCVEVQVNDGSAMMTSLIYFEDTQNVTLTTSNNVTVECYRLK